MRKPIGENKTIQRVLPPADADAFEQHAANRQDFRKRVKDAYEDDAVKFLIDATATEESRERHYNVVDRRDLAKLLNNAKKQGYSGYKVERNDLPGYKYLLTVFKESRQSKKAYDKQNKEADEKIKEQMKQAFDRLKKTKSYAIIYGVIDTVKRKYFPISFIECKDDAQLRNELKKLDKKYNNKINHKVMYYSQIEGKETLEEAFKSKSGKALQDVFQPKEEAEDLWQTILDSGKLDELEDLLLEEIGPHFTSSELNTFLVDAAELVKERIKLEAGVAEEEDIEAEDDEEDLGIDLDEFEDIDLEDDIDNPFADHLNFDDLDDVDLDSNLEEKEGAEELFLITSRNYDRYKPSHPDADKFYKEIKNNKLEKEFAKFIDKEYPSGAYSIEIDTLLRFNGNDIIDELRGSGAEVFPVDDEDDFALPSIEELDDNSKGKVEEPESDKNELEALSEAFLQNHYTAANNRINSTDDLFDFKKASKNTAPVAISDAELDGLLGMAHVPVVEV